MRNGPIVVEEEWVHVLSASPMLVATEALIGTSDPGAWVGVVTEDPSSREASTPGGAELRFTRPATSPDSVVKVL